MQRKIIKKFNKEQKDLFSLLLGKVLVVILSLISIRIATTLLNAQELGKNYLLLTLITFIGFTFLAPLGQFFSRQIIDWKQRGLINVSINILIILRLIATLFSIAIALLIYHYADYGKYFTISSYAFFLFMSLIGLTTLLFLSSINILGNRSLFTKLTIVLALLSVIISTSFVSILEPTGMNWLYGITVAQLVLLIPSYLLLTKNCTTKFLNITEKFNFSYIKKVLLFIVPTTITLFLQWGQNSSYRFLVEAKYSIELLGLMGVGFAISTAVFTAIDHIATQYFNPIYFRVITGADEKERAQAWNAYAINLMSIYVLTVVFIVSTAPFLLKLLVAESYHSVYQFVMLGAIVEFFRVSCNVIYMISQSELNTTKTIFPYAFGFATLILVLFSFNFAELSFMIPVTQALTYFIIGLLLYRNMRKVLPVKLNVLPLMKVLIYSLPLLLLLLVTFDLSVLYSIVAVAVAGGYFVLIAYKSVFTKVLRESKDKELY